MATATLAPPPIKLRVWVCANWGHSYIAEFEDEQVAIAFVDRKSSTCAFSEVDGEVIDDRYPELIERLYPTCPHGLSLDLCLDPISHY